MIIASFNANGIRPRTPIIIDWLKKNSPEILCIQETKVQDPDFPKKPFFEAGYYSTFKGQKSYNGVAILSRKPPKEVKIGLNDGEKNEEARFIAIKTTQEITIVNTYVPQGQRPYSEKFNYKLEYFQRLLAYFRTHFNPDQPLVWVGDLNVAPSPIDVYDPEKLAGSVCFHPDEHEALKKVMSFGFHDLYRKHKPNKQEFTFWDYRIPNAAQRGIGWRIDHILGTSKMSEKCLDVWIDISPRLLQRPSDHTFIAAKFDL